MRVTSSEVKKKGQGEGIRSKCARTRIYLSHYNESIILPVCVSRIRERALRMATGNGGRLGTHLGC